MPIREIHKEVLNLILHSSRSSHPNEFAGILRAEEKRVTEVLVLPGTFSSDRSVLLRLNMLPISSRACGSVHSHTSTNIRPSRADLNFFNKLGEVHVIVTPPYDETSWKAYNSRGSEISLEVVESENRELVSRKFSEDFFGT